MHCALHRWSGVGKPGCLLVVSPDPDRCHMKVLSFPFPFVYSVYSSKYVTTALILLFCVVTIISHKMQSCKLLYISYYYSLFTFPADMSEEAIQNQHERGIEKTSKLWKYALIKYMHEGSSNCGIPLFWCFKNSPPNQEKLFFMKIIMLSEPAPTRVLGWLFFLFS